VIVILGVTLIFSTLLLIHCQRIKKRLQVENESYKKSYGGKGTDNDKELVRLGPNAIEDDKKEQNKQSSNKE
jgi:hypothetical protein